MNLSKKIKLVLKNPRNLKNYYFHARDLRYRPLVKKAQFVSAQIEPTTRCNLTCKMCLHSFNKIQKPDMSFGQFKDILDQLPYLANLVLQGLGEPMLNPELFLMIKEAKKRGIRVGLTTNATLLNEATGRQLIDSGLDWLYISIDSTDKDIYEKIRVGASFEKAVENVRLFAKMNSKIDIGFWTLVMEETVNGLAGVVDLADELGVKKIVFQSAIHNWGHDEFGGAAGVSKNLEEFIGVIKEKKGRIKAEINISVKDGKKCDWPWRSLYITADGFLTPCCMQGSDPDVVNFGNVFETPIKDIVNNEKYQEFRKKLNSAEPPGICGNCPVYYQQKVIRV